ncbi:(2Fe-2S)-binding protein [Pandoraea sp.]|uniref:(2Fe-2S)-binding protein n=1 Tax=Pandoraea sp. TaxID=1883445 RepID=UPI00121DA723|nr:(2Fe-2S)-binding protein [Pandoraea sp.]TAL56885.1 MAG: (2Fe-2S)-binding protein [Pandoraea sp.]TAM17679.1 MAG: (2Fe-2S)-binding protein [Pandoraea sp.]
MPTDLLFKTLPRAEHATVRIYIDDRAHDVPGTLSVAAALLAAGHLVCRTTPVGGNERAPFCMMGVCFDCLVEIDGVPNRQGCMTPVRDGMHVRRMQGARSIA